MKKEIIERIVYSPFETVYTQLKENILAEGFLILHEIDTQSIVSKHGQVPRGTSTSPAVVAVVLHHGQ